MNAIALLYSLVGGVTVAVVGHMLTNRHQLLMKRELYREILYREKVRAYGEVYALAASYVHYFKNADTLPISVVTKKMPETLVALRKAIIDRGIFMPDAIMDAMGDIEYFHREFIEGSPELIARYKIASDAPEEVLNAFSGAEECETVMNVLKQDLGVETLTKDLGEFFATASLKREAKWKKLFQGKRGKVIGRHKNNGAQKDV